MNTHSRPSWVPAGLLLGAGLGGFFDGILFHQLLQWHNMLSGWVPVNDLVSAKINMFWDGVFHAGVWGLTLLGLLAFWRAGAVPRREGDGPVLFGSMLLGWGLFNTIEGTIDHFALGIHHVREYVVEPAPWDWAFLASGLVLSLTGIACIVRGVRTRKHMEARAGAPG